MRRSHMIAVSLIVIVVAILLAGQFTGMASGDEQEPVEIETLEVSHPELEIEYTKYRIEDRDNYYPYKTINYYLRSFFDGVNDKDIDLSLVDQEYMDFMGYDEADLLKPYSILDVVDYDIARITKGGDRVIVHLSYRDIGIDKFYQRKFSLMGTTICDRPFVGIEDIGKRTELEDYSVDVVSKAVFDTYEIYKIDVENRSEKELIVDDSMYGFNAIKGDNKYYHTLESAKLPYELVPGEIRSFLIRFDVLNPKEINVVIDGEETRVY